MILLLLPVASAAELVRPPYVQTVTPTEATLVWMADEETSATLTWGESLENEETLDSTVQHEVRLQGLSASTTYAYQVALDADVLFESSFTTAPELGSTEPVRIWVVGDSGTGSSDQAEVRDAMTELTALYPPQLYVHVGDMAYNSGTEDEFTDKFFLQYSDILDNIPVWPAIGNHEGAQSDSETQTGPYYEAYVLPTDARAGGVESGTEAYYSFDWANLHVIALDSHESDRSVDGAQLTWLAQDLAATEQDWIIAFWHHPPYSKGSHDSDFENTLIEMRENALPILESYGVDLVLAGHSHVYERSHLVDGAYETPTTDAGILDAGDGSLVSDGAYEKPEGTSPNAGAIYVVAGHGGTGVRESQGHPIMAYSEGRHGSVLIDVNDNVLTLRNLRHDREISDQATIVKGSALVLNQPNGGTLAADEVQTIGWAAVGDVSGPVTVEWSCDGSTWETLAEGQSATGSMEWTVPAVDAEGRIRVTSDSGHSDDSDAPFDIAERVIALPWGSEWSYLDDGTEPESDWKTAENSWPLGVGEFGYGDGDEATTLLDTDPKIASVYFRHTLSTGALSKASLDVRFDDGVVIWLDGVEVYRVGIDDDDYEAFGTVASAENQTDTVALGSLAAGDHELAVMVKQFSDMSTDLSFDLELSGLDRDSELESCTGPDTGDTGDTGTDDTGDTADTSDTAPTDTDTDTDPPDSPSDSDPPDTPPPDDERCGCGASTGPSSAAPLGLLGVLLIRRRRRR